MKEEEINQEIKQKEPRKERRKLTDYIHWHYWMFAMRIEYRLVSHVIIILILILMLNINNNTNHDLLDEIVVLFPLIIELDLFTDFCS